MLWGSSHHARTESGREPCKDPGWDRGCSAHAQAGGLDGAVRDRDWGRVGCPYHRQCPSPGTRRGQCPDVPELPTGSPGRAHSSSSAQSAPHYRPAAKDRRWIGQFLGPWGSRGLGEMCLTPLAGCAGCGTDGRRRVLCCGQCFLFLPQPCPADKQHHAGSPWVGVSVYPHAVTVVRVCSPSTAPLNLWIAACSLASPSSQPLPIRGAGCPSPSMCQAPGPCAPPASPSVP